MTFVQPAGERDVRAPARFRTSAPYGTDQAATETAVSSGATEEAKTAPRGTETARGVPP